MKADTPLLTMDHPEVQNCPGHEWVFEDRTPEGLSEMAALKSDTWYWCVVCKHCHGARCGHLNDPNPCILARHHRIDHEFLHGGTRPVGA